MNADHFVKKQFMVYNPSWVKYTTLGKFKDRLKPEDMHVKVFTATEERLNATPLNS